MLWLSQHGNKLSAQYVIGNPGFRRDCDTSKPYRNVLLRQELFPGADGVVASEFFGRGKRQAAFALEQFLQPLVAGTALASDDSGRDEFAQFPAMTPPFQPIFVAD